MGDAPTVNTNATTMPSPDVQLGYHTVEYAMSVVSPDAPRWSGYDAIMRLLALTSLLEAVVLHERVSIAVYDDWVRPVSEEDVIARLVREGVIVVHGMPADLADDVGLNVRTVWHTVRDYVLFPDENNSNDDDFEFPIGPRARSYCGKVALVAAQALDAERAGRSCRPSVWPPFPRRGGPP